LKTIKNPGQEVLSALWL